MLSYDQIAVRTQELDAQIELMEELGLLSWVRDRVDATHIYVDPSLRHALGTTFQVKLAFNYEHIPGVEFELIQLTDGMSVQMIRSGVVSHFGYHVLDPEPDTLNTPNDTLLKELQRLHGLGIVTQQISQTTNHQGTKRRYRYAFCTTNKNGGMPIKVIQRIGEVKKDENASSLAAGMKAFACLRKL